MQKRVLHQHVVGLQIITILICKLSISGTESEQFAQCETIILLEIFYHPPMLSQFLSCNMRRLIYIFTFGLNNYAIYSFSSTELTAFQALTP